MSYKKRNVTENIQSQADKTNKSTNTNNINSLINTALIKLSTDVQ